MAVPRQHGLHAWQRLRSEYPGYRTIEQTTWVGGIGAGMKSNWVLHIFQMSSEQGRALVARMLSRIDGLLVEVGASGPDRFLIVNCDSEQQASAVNDFVSAVDPDSVIIHTSGVEVPAALTG